MIEYWQTYFGKYILHSVVSSGPHMTHRKFYEERHKYCEKYLSALFNTHTYTHISISNGSYRPWHYLILIFFIVRYFYCAECKAYSRKPAETIIRAKFLSYLSLYSLNEKFNDYPLHVQRRTGCRSERLWCGYKRNDQHIYASFVLRTNMERVGVT